MGQPDLTLKPLLTLPDVAADIINAIVYQGETRVREEDLRELSPLMGVSQADRKLIELTRDVCLEDVRSGSTYLIFGLENQLSDDLTMPLRVMGYDYAACHRQVKLLQEENRRRGRTATVRALLPGQRIPPVITLVLYYGYAPSTMPRELQGMMRMPEDALTRAWIVNYPIKIIELGRMSREEINLFKSDFRHIAKYVHSRYTKSEDFEAQVRADDHLDHVKETAMALSALTKDSRYLQLGQKEGEGSMCPYIDQWLDRGMAQGVAQGKEETMRSCMEIFEKLLQEGRAEEAKRAASDVGFLQQLIDGYHTTTANPQG